MSLLSLVLSCLSKIAAAVDIISVLSAKSMLGKDIDDLYKIINFQLAHVEMI